jgi:hypothetical protein
MALIEVRVGPESGDDQGKDRQEAAEDWLDAEEYGLGPILSVIDG